MAYRLNSRDVIWSKARLEADEFMAALAARHGLTYGELFAIFGHLMQSWAKWLTRDEREETKPEPPLCNACWKKTATVRSAVRLSDDNNYPELRKTVKSTDTPTWTVRNAGARRDASRTRLRNLDRHDGAVTSAPCWGLHNAVALDGERENQVQLDSGHTRYGIRVAVCDDRNVVGCGCDWRLSFFR